jgi:hypothetical protein
MIAAATLSVVKITCVQNDSANVQYLKPGTVASEQYLKPGTVASRCDVTGRCALLPSSSDGIVEGFG